MTDQGGMPGRDVTLSLRDARANPLPKLTHQHKRCTMTSRGGSKKALDAVAPPPPSATASSDALRVKVPLPPAEAPAPPPPTTSDAGIVAAALQATAAAEAPTSGATLPAAAPPQPEKASAPVTPAANGSALEQPGSSETLVDVIRREQANQMQQARTKGTQAQGQKRSGSEGVAAAGSASAAKAYCHEDGLFIDEEQLLAASTFPVPPARLIELAKAALRTGVHKCDNLAEDFQFSAPFIGPLPREGFADVMQTLALDDVFPDMSPRIYHLRVDPLQPDRVWFTTRPIGTHTGFLTAKLPVPQPPTGRVVELPPQTSSLTFNEHEQIVDFTMGYVQDRRLGNSGGLGGAFGFLWALGCPFPYPEGKPWTASWQQQAFNSGHPLLQAAVFVLDRLSTALLPAWLTTRHNRGMP